MIELVEKYAIFKLILLYFYLLPLNPNMPSIWWKIVINFVALHYS